jgi:hypothetical protein
VTVSPKKKLTQALPSARRRANLKRYVTRAWKDNITELAMQAYRGPSPEDEAMEPLAVVLAPVKVQELAEEYVSVKHHKAPLKEFRRITGKKGHSLRKKLHDLLESLPGDTEPPFPQMREKFCIQREAAQHRIDKAYSLIEVNRIDMEDLWDEAYSPTEVKRVLGSWITLMDEVNEDAGGKHSGADTRTAEIEFALGLAHYWQDCLGNKVARWGEDDPYSETTKNPDVGPFPRFVREAAEIIPPKYLPKSWNWAIRSAIDRLKNGSWVAKR